MLSDAIWRRQYFKHVFIYIPYGLQHSLLEIVHSGGHLSTDYSPLLNNMRFQRINFPGWFYLNLAHRKLGSFEKINDETNATIKF